MNSNSIQENETANLEVDASAASSYREELVDTAVKFLQNPKVINSPLAQKQKFLQRRGLSEDEIRIACEKSGAYDHYEKQLLSPNSPLPTSQPTNMLTSYRGYGPIQVSWFDRLREIVHSIAIFSIVAYVVKKFYEMYIAPFLFGTEKKSVGEKLDNLEKNVGDSMRGLQNSLRDVRAEVDRINYSSENELMSELKDLKSEITTVKGLLLTRKQFPSVNNPVVPPSIPAWQMSSVHQGNETEGDNDEHKEELLEVGSGSGSSEPEHGMKTSESSLEIIYSSKDCDTESCHSKKSSREGNLTD
ncbi:peroxisomal membrane protein PEX14 isoform X1 [Euwallacea similis]|uniref:peroxisomal membrane protein PEX14 isoform X1 n=1 Tax=Euwallacea similis TaxID=1736056 RepID=UPI00344F9EAA